MRVALINGPNLNLIGRREPEVYGKTDLVDLEAKVVAWGEARGVPVHPMQSNDEAEIINYLHQTDVDGVIINPGAFSHTSHAIADAIRAIDHPVVEVHISNIRKREPWRAHSVITDACVRSIYGRGLVGYRDALFHLANRVAMPFEIIRYGPDPENIGDLRGQGDDLVVFAHGGIWRQEFERDTTESIAVDLAGSGWTTWNLEYRRLGNGGGWPGSGHDVLMALDHVQNLTKTYQRVIVVGHSAGSYLLMWAAGRTSTPVDFSLQLAGVFDLEACVTADLVGKPDCATMIEMGAPSPIGPGPIQTVLYHGTNDQISAVSQSADLADHDSVEFIRTASGHFEWLDPTKEEWQIVKTRIESLR